MCVCVKCIRLFLRIFIGGFKLDFILLSVKIDFEQSHLYFPRIIVALLILLIIAIAIIHLPSRIREIRNGHKHRFFIENYNKIKLYGTIFLIAAYFKGMEIVGGFFPNMGYGFLISSIIFMLLISMLFVEKLTKKTIITLVVNSLLTPTLAWYIFGVLFHISLP